MKHINYFFLAGWLFFWVGMTCQSVGQAFSGGVYDARLPIAMIALLGITAFFGWAAGNSK